MSELQWRKRKEREVKLRWKIGNSDSFLVGEGFGTMEPGRSF